MKEEHYFLIVKHGNKLFFHHLRKMFQLNSLHIYIQQRNSSPITMEWLEEQRTRFNHSNCIIINDRQDHYFWFG